MDVCRPASKPSSGCDGTPQAIGECAHAAIACGQIVQATEGFDPPAPLHGGCRCTETILTADEI